MIANLTDNVVCGDEWVLLSGEGEVYFTCESASIWGFSPSIGTEPLSGHPLPANHWFMESGRMLKLSAGQFIWVKAEPGSVFTVTATNPAIA